MSDETKRTAMESDADVEEVELPALSALLKRSLSVEAPSPASKAAGVTDAPSPTVESAVADDAEKDRLLLASVQKKLRQRSKGKFYADGWSTSQSRVSYALVAGIMLVVIVAVYLALGPMGISQH